MSGDGGDGDGDSDGDNGNVVKGQAEVDVT